MKLLGFHKVNIERAEGMYYIDQNGRKILDFFGGFGSLAFGHNHPRILAARKQIPGREAPRDRHGVHVAICGGAGARHLPPVSPGDLDMVFLGSSVRRRWRRRSRSPSSAAGPEAVEDRLCRELLPRQDQGRALGHRRPALPRRVQAGRQQRASAVRRHRGDRDARSSRTGRSASSCLETVQGGGGIIQRAAEYWQKLRAAVRPVRRAVDRRRSAVRLGRTGRFYAFEHDGVVPDVTALAKSLGGGKARSAR